MAKASDTRSNRTFMELKSDSLSDTPEKNTSSNRTFMELKYCDHIGWGGGGIVF